VTALVEDLNMDDAENAIKNGYSVIKHAAQDGDRMVAMTVLDVMVLTTMASLWWQGE
jgi:hypothetical protein